MDAWVMAKSWANPKVMAYEIKVTRSDFLGDEKWRGYLGSCNEFYFVCPPKLIQPDELPTEAGLIWTSINAARLYTKKKAPYRDIEVDETVFRYVLMCRTLVTRERGGSAEYWRDWLAEKVEKRDIGYRVSRAIRDHVNKVECENRRLQKEHADLQELRGELVKLGLLTEDGYASTFAVQQRAKQLAAGVDTQLLRLCKDLRSAIDRLSHRPGGHR
jgi:hypothetical protein